jgi:cyclopropane-fatty-acyl-phospholipid synthase
MISKSSAYVSTFPSVSPAMRPVERWFRGQVMRRLATITSGRLVITDADGQYVIGSGDSSLEVLIADGRTWGEVATSGTVGAGTAWIRGWWTCADPVGLVRYLIRNRSALDGLETGLARWSMPVLRAVHAWRSNTKAGSKRNISAHYDLGNEFFSRWLDPTLLYSSAYFEHPEQTLGDAQVSKCERLCQRLDLRFDDHLLEIGTGWGGFAIHAARVYGCRVTTTTISREQYDLAKQRVREAGLEHRIHVLLRDYRELDGTYDKVVSIEMIEAVGHRFYDQYFATISKLLRPNGLAALQAITIAEQRYDQAIRAVDYIQRYIFPGSCIPSLGAITASIARSSDLNLVEFEDITPHYARTLSCWRNEFQAQLPAIRELGYDDYFIRMWDFYLAYCEGGFAERAIGCTHLLFARGQWRSPLQQRWDQ